MRALPSGSTPCWTPASSTRCCSCARGDLHLDLPSIRCVGYRQAWESLDGLYPMDSLRERGIAATRQLAKRQITWLRSMPARHAIACDTPDAQQQLLQAAMAVVAAATQARNG